MTSFKGSILELKDKKAIVMTNTCSFVTIKRQPGMFIGQQITIKKSEIYRTNKSYLKYLALASMFILVFCSILFFQIFAPNTVFAYIDIDINPSLEFAIDKDAKIVDIKPINKDAQTLLKDLKLVALPLKQAVAMVVEESQKQGFISSEKENAILISASIKTNKDNTSNAAHEKVLDTILSDVQNTSFDIGNEVLKPEILKVTPENRNTAVKNNISMGRYELYSKLKKKNADITVEEAKNKRVYDMLEKADMDGSGKNKPDSKVKKSEEKNNQGENSNKEDSSKKNNNKHPSQNKAHKDKGKFTDNGNHDNNNSDNNYNDDNNDNNDNEKINKNAEKKITEKENDDSSDKKETFDQGSTSNKSDNKSDKKHKKAEDAKSSDRSKLQNINDNKNSENNKKNSNDNGNNADR